MLKSKPFLFVLTPLFFAIACNNNEPLEVVNNTPRIDNLDSALVADNHIDYFMGFNLDSNQLHVRCDTSNYGSIRMEYANYAKQYFGQFTRNIMIPVFDFVPETSLSVSINRSQRYGDNILTVSGNGGYDSLQIEIHYLNAEFDTTCIIYDRLNLIPMRAYSAYEDQEIRVSFNFPDFELRAREFDYYTTGIAIEHAHSIDIAYFCHYGTSVADSITMHTDDFSSGTKKSHYDTFSVEE